LSEPKEIKRAAQKWDEHVVNSELGAVTGLAWWEAGPAIDEHINQKITGRAGEDWVSYTLRTHFQGKLPVAECLVLGCGTGHLERKLAGLGVFEHCDAYDVSIGSVETAVSLAWDAGYSHINYQIANVNELVLPASHYDMVWISAAMHHFSALEFIYQQISQGLKTDGLLVMFEYVGPNRFQFSQRQKEVANLCLRLLPEKYRILRPQAIESEIKRSPLNHGAGWFASRLVAKTREGDLLRLMKRRLRAYRSKYTGGLPVKDSVSFPTESSVTADDPSEAVRSQELLIILGLSFDIVELTGFGGNITQYLLNDIAGNFSEDDQNSQSLLRMIQMIEDTLIQCGEFEDDFAYIVASPKPVTSNTG
jgi:SAM-dependent methyltransferase